MWTKAPLCHKGRHPSLATAAALLGTRLCQRSELLLLENQTLSMSNGPKQDRFQPRRDRHEAGDEGRASGRKEWGETRETGESYTGMIKMVEEGRKRSAGRGRGQRRQNLRSRK